MSPAEGGSSARGSRRFVVECPDSHPFGPDALTVEFAPDRDVDRLAVLHRLGPLPAPVRSAQDPVESAVTAAAAAWSLLTDDEPHADRGHLSSASTRSASAV